MVREMSVCPICNTNQDSEQTNFCTTCSWDLTPYPLTLGGIPDAYLEKERTKIQWAKQNWQRLQQLETVNIQEKDHYTQQIQEQKTQLQIQAESLERERSDRQEQIDLLQRRLAQVSSDRDAAKSQLEQIEREGLPQAKQEAEKLRQKIRQVEDQLYEVERAKKVLKDQLNQADRTKKLLQERDRTAKTALSWLFNNLAERFAEELASISNRGEAIAKIQNLHSKRLNQDWADQPHRLEFIKTLPNLLGFSYEKQLDKIKESLRQLGDDDPIIGADALLSVRAELKYQGIVKRDADGDLPYSV